MFAVKHSPFDMVPQVRKRGEDGRKRPAAVMVKQSWHVLEQKIRRPSGFSQAGNFKEESTSCIVKSFSAASERKRLAGESPTQKVEVGQVVGVNGSGVWIVSLLLPDVVDRAVTGFGIFVDLAVSDALEAADAGQPRPKAADPGEHIKISNQMVSSPSCSARRKPRTSSSTAPACSCCVVVFGKETPASSSRIAPRMASSSSCCSI